MLLVSFMACTSHKVSMSSTETTPYKTIAQAKLGTGVDYILNEDKDYVLCIKKESTPSGNPQKSVHYLVIDVKNNDIVLQDKQENATVQWRDAKHIEVFHIPGVVRKDQNRNDFVTLYNVETGEKSYPPNNQNDSYRQLAVSKLGDNLQYLPNADGNYMLCVHEVKGTSLQPANQITYLVIRVSDNAIVHESKFTGGQVGWFSKQEIEVYRTPGIMQKGETDANYTTLYNIVTGSKRSKASLNSH